MFCPQCGKESDNDPRYCRSCGANLKVIAKAASLGEAIARSDRGPLPKIKEMLSSIKIDAVTDEVSRALERVNQEIVRSSARIKPPRKSWREFIHRESPAERRERYILKGTASMFSGVGLMVFLYYFAGSLVLKISPADLAKIPFELEPALKMFWLVGLIPTLSGAGRILGGLMISTKPAKTLSSGTELPALPAINRSEFDTSTQTEWAIAPSVTENTTSLLNNKVPTHGNSSSQS